VVRLLVESAQSLVELVVMPGACFVIALCLAHAHHSMILRFDQVTVVRWSQPRNLTVAIHLGSVTASG
jgi:hypothetical protein